MPNTPMGRREAELKNPLALAFVGDTVWDLLVRQRLLTTAARVNALHRQATSMVNAGAQAAALTRLEPLLTETEHDIVRRGANAHSKHMAPKNRPLSITAAQPVWKRSSAGYTCRASRRACASCLKWRTHPNKPPTQRPRAIWRRADDPAQAAHGTDRHASRFAPHHNRKHTYTL